MIATDETNGVLTITLSRPDKANALTEQMLREIADIVSASQAKVLILTGAGRVFSAGADLEDVQNNGLATSDQWERASGAIADFAGLSIAALNGTVAGGANGIVLACDVRIAVSGAKFFYPVMRLGHLPQPSDPKRIERLIGPARTKMILMGGAKIEAAQAQDWGLIDQISETPVETAMDLSQDVLGATSEHVSAIKALIP